MVRVAVLAVAALLASLPSFAQTVVVLDADFDSDTVGQPPDESLPGPPDGDSLILTGVSANGTFTVVESAGTLANQPVEVVRTGGTTGFGATFQLPPDAWDCDRLVFRWCSVALSPIQLQNFWFAGPTSGNFQGILNFRNGGAITLSPDVGVPNEITVGSWTQGVGQCFEWHHDRSTGRQSLYIDGTPAIEDVQTAWDTSAGGVVLFRYAMALQDPFTFAFDDVEISVVDCTSPVEESGWGRVKASYR